jgi:signal transduction histidine kinase
MPVNPQILDLPELIAEIDSQVRVLLAEDVELHWQLPTEQPPISSDLAKLKVILKNLTTNAVKFTKRGSVTVRFQVSPDHLLLEVDDTGIGMTPEAADIVFEPFQQADASIQRDFGGAGLGLHIVKRLVTVLHGTIELDSAPQQGTTIRVRLPQLRPASLSAA